jgi:Integrase
MLRVFAHWIGKDGMVEATQQYVDPALAQRSSVCTHDLSWSAQGVDVAAKLAEASQKDERVGLQLRLELESGLRGKEAMMLRPHLADKGAYLDVSVGTKGGRLRAVPINTAGQRALLDEAKAFAATKDSSTSDPSRSLAQWKNHYYYVLRSCGISRKNGITAHGCAMLMPITAIRNSAARIRRSGAVSWSTARMTGLPASRWRRNWGILGNRSRRIIWGGTRARITESKDKLAP